MEVWSSTSQGGLYLSGRPSISYDGAEDGDLTVGVSFNVSELSQIPRGATKALFIMSFFQPSSLTVITDMTLRRQLPLQMRLFTSNITWWRNVQLVIKNMRIICNNSSNILQYYWLFSVQHIKVIIFLKTIVLTFSIWVNLVYDWLFGCVHISIEKKKFKG